MKAPVRYRGKRQLDFERRWTICCREAGPPPSLAAVPVVGYAANGVVYRSRWRGRPGAKT